MSRIYWLLIILAGFWAVLLALNKWLDLEERGAEIGPGMMIWRTNWGIELLDKIANLSKRTWLVFGISGAIIGVFLMTRTFYFLLNSAFSILVSLTAQGVSGAASQAGGVAPIIPGITTPLVSGLIAIGVVVIVHELSHGVIARRANLEVESTGFGILAFLPLAFVEPDEEELESASFSDKLQVFAAGSFSNILVAVLCFFLILLLVNPLPGLFVYDVVENTPAEDTLRPGMKLTGIGYSSGSIENIQDYSDFNSFLENTSPGESIVLNTAEEGYINLTLGHRENKDIGYIGIYPIWSVSEAEEIGQFSSILFKFWEPPGPSNLMMRVMFYPQHHSYEFYVPGFVLTALAWVLIFNLGVGLFNLLPLVPLDGGRIFSDLVGKVSSESVSKYLTWTVSGITLFLILLNFIPFLTRVI